MSHHLKNPNELCAAYKINRGVAAKPFKVGLFEFLPLTTTRPRVRLYLSLPCSSTRTSLPETKTVNACLDLLPNAEMVWRVFSRLSGVDVFPHIVRFTPLNEAQTAKLLLEHMRLFHLLIQSRCSHVNLPGYIGKCLPQTPQLSTSTNQCFLRPVGPTPSR